MTQGTLGSKHECRVCGTKFYDLGKPKAICPQCGTEQKDLTREKKTSASSRRRRPGPVVKEPILVPDVIDDDAGDGFDDDKADIDVTDLDGLEDDEEEE